MKTPKAIINPAPDIIEWPVISASIEKLNIYFVKF
jgi:hypothetical protein